MTERQISALPRPQIIVDPGFGLHELAVYDGAITTVIHYDAYKKEWSGYRAMARADRPVSETIDMTPDEAACTAQALLPFNEGIGQ